MYEVNLGGYLQNKTSIEVDPTLIREWSDLTTCTSYEMGSVLGTLLRRFPYIRGIS